MMALYAAKRLKRVIAERVPVFAMADEGAARAFIKSVANISVGTRLPSAPNQIVFNVHNLADFRTARAALIRRYGKSTTKYANHQSEAGTWEIDSEKSITLGDWGTNAAPYTITLIDLAHKESVSQMLKRLAKR